MNASRKNQGRHENLIWACAIVGIPILVIVAVTSSMLVYLHVSEEAGETLLLLIGGVIALAIVSVGLYAMWRFFQGDMTRDDDTPGESVADHSVRDEIVLWILLAVVVALWMAYLQFAEGWVPGLGELLMWATAFELGLAIAGFGLVMAIITVSMAVRGIVHRFRGE